MHKSVRKIIIIIERLIRAVQKRQLTSSKPSVGSTSDIRGKYTEGVVIIIIIYLISIITIYLIIITIYLIIITIYLIIIIIMWEWAECEHPAFFVARMPKQNQLTAFYGGDIKIHTCVIMIIIINIIIIIIISEHKFFAAVSKTSRPQAKMIRCVRNSGLWFDYNGHM